MTTMEPGGGRAAVGGGTRAVRRGAVRVAAGCAVLASMLLAAPAIAAPFVCADGDFYQIRAGGGGSILSTIDRTVSPYQLSPLYTVPALANGLGYNPTDNYLYAISSNAPRRLQRLGNTGVELANVTITGIPTTSSLDAGAFDLAGRYWVAYGDGTVVRISGVTGASPAPVATTLTRVADPSPRAGYTGVSNLLVGDWAENPVESSPGRIVLYGLRQNEGGVQYLYRAVVDNPDTATQIQVSRRPTSGVTTANAFGTVFMDQSGAMYVYKNDSTADAGFYHIDVATGIGTAVSGSASTSQSDGAVCPLAPPLVQPTLVLNKVTTGAAGGPFGFTLTNTGQAAGTATTVTAGSPVQVDGDTANVGTQPFTVGAFDTEVTIAESTLPPGWALASAQCTVASGGGATPVGSFSAATRTYTIPASAVVSGAQFTCTFSNARQATLQVLKALPDGRVVAADQFALAVAGDGGPWNATTTGTGSTVVGQIDATLVPGSTYAISEAAAAGADLASYATTWACSNARAGGQAPSGSGIAFSVTPVVDDQLTCTFTNRATVADLSITKDNGQTELATGSTTTYQIVVANAGPGAADNAVVRDEVVEGLSACTVTGCSATGAASCPATPADILLPAGATIPALPAGGQVTFAVQCTVD